MAATGSDFSSVDDSSVENLQALYEKRDVVEGFLHKTTSLVLELRKTRDLSLLQFVLLGDGAGLYRVFFWETLGNWVADEGVADEDDWKHVLGRGLGTKFQVVWSKVKYITDIPRVLHQGAALFLVMTSRGLNPEWDGTTDGVFSITVVHKEGAKLGLAMALHPRLGATSRLSRVRPLTLILAGGV